MLTKSTRNLFMNIMNFTAFSQAVIKEAFIKLGKNSLTLLDNLTIRCKVSEKIQNKSHFYSHLGKCVRPSTRRPVWRGTRRRRWWSPSRSAGRSARSRWGDTGRDRGGTRSSGGGSAARCATPWGRPSSGRSLTPSVRKSPSRWGNSSYKFSGHTLHFCNARRVRQITAPSCRGSRSASTPPRTSPWTARRRCVTSSLRRCANRSGNLHIQTMYIVHNHFMCIVQSILFLTVVLSIIKWLSQGLPPGAETDSKGNLWRNPSRGLLHNSSESEEGVHPASDQVVLQSRGEWDGGYRHWPRRAPSALILLPLLIPSPLPPSAPSPPWCAQPPTVPPPAPRWQGPGSVLHPLLRQGPVPAPGPSLSLISWPVSGWAWLPPGPLSAIGGPLPSASVRGAGGNIQISTVIISSPKILMPLTIFIYLLSL